MNVFKMLWASMVIHHKQYFFNKSIYVSLSIWPILSFLTTYYSYKSFSSQVFMTKMGLKHEDEIFLYLLIGFIGMMTFHTLIQSAWQSANLMRFSGTLEVMYITPVNRMIVIIGHTLASLLGSVWMVMIYFIAMVIRFNSLLEGKWTQLMFGILLLLIVSTCWGIFLHSLFLSSRDSGFLFTVFQMPVDMFSGAKLPFQLMPVWAKIFGYALPLTYGLQVVRGIVLTNKGLSDLSSQLIIGLALSFTLVAASFYITYLAERRAKISGSATLF